MFYLFVQTLFWIILAVLFGIFVGWLIWNRLCSRKNSEIESLRRKTEAQQNDIDRLKQDLEACRKNLKPQKTTAEPIKRLFHDEPQMTPDNLQLIKGVGPFLEQKLKANGINTFKQIAGLSSRDIEQLGSSFGSFGGRIIWDNWQNQAEELDKQA